MIELLRKISDQEFKGWKKLAYNEISEEYVIEARFSSSAVRLFVPKCVIEDASMRDAVIEHEASKMIEAQA
jgi:hypothetical protein